MNPFRVHIPIYSVTQGFTLGCHIEPFQGAHSATRVRASNSNFGIGALTGPLEAGS